MEELKKAVHFDTSPYIKNLFCKDKKSNFFLVLALTDTKVEKAFWKKAGTTGGNISPAKPEHLE